MRISSEGLALIKRFEGFSAMPYICPAGYRTVGYGHVVKDSDRGEYPLSEEEAEALLLEDVVLAEMAVRRLTDVPLEQRQFDALVSFTFNVGAAALQRSTLRRVVNRGEHESAPRELMRWVYANGRILRGLVARREAEAALYSPMVTG